MCLLILSLASILWWFCPETWHLWQPTLLYTSIFLSDGQRGCLFVCWSGQSTDCYETKVLVASWTFETDQWKNRPWIPCLSTRIFFLFFRFSLSLTLSFFTLMQWRSESWIANHLLYTYYSAPFLLQPCWHGLSQSIPSVDCSFFQLLKSWRLVALCEHGRKGRIQGRGKMELVARKQPRNSFFIRTSLVLINTNDFCLKCHASGCSIISPHVTHIDSDV
jgi:hypothetical protein